MPTTHKIPAYTLRVCEPCEFHKLIGVFHVRSGKGGYREYACTHPSTWDELESKYIGKTDTRPKWCPLKEPKEI